MGQFGRRQCDNETCSEHSGINEKVLLLQKIVEKIEARFYHILISILITMFASGLTAAFTAYSAISARIDKMHEERQRLVIERKLNEWNFLDPMSLLASVESVGKDMKIWIPDSYLDWTKQEK